VGEQTPGPTFNPPTQYSTDENLASRQRLWSTSRRVPEFDLFSWVLDLGGITSGSTQSTLDVGCGNGAYERALTTRGHRGPRVALDLSAGMLPLVSDAAIVLADAQKLPFCSAWFDLVLAPHMLYHVPDIESAAKEIRRVLRPTGLFVAVTNSVSNLQELRALVEAAVGSDWKMLRPADERFSMENGTQLLSSAFESVVRVDCPSTHLVVTDVYALAQYVASVADHYESQVDIPWSTVTSRVYELANEAMASNGQLRFSTGAGAFVCR
jgi:SAM-dependent methyltransferase